MGRRTDLLSRERKQKEVEEETEQKNKVLPLAKRYLNKSLETEVFYLSTEQKQTEAAAWKPTQLWR